MKKRAQLVSQHLENVSRKALEDHSEIIRHYARNRQGVYVLYKNGKLKYVGLATNLRNRLKQHLKDNLGGSWDSFSIYFTIGDYHLHELEALILRILKPAENKQRGKFEKSEDIKSIFRRDIKSAVLRGVDEMFGNDLEKDRRRKTKINEEGQPVLAKYNLGSKYLNSRYKGDNIVARVRRDGKIWFKGKVYNSPSVAAAAACNRISCNGWTFWKYERAPGDWVLIDELRK